MKKYIFFVFFVFLVSCKKKYKYVDYFTNGDGNTISSITNNISTNYGFNLYSKCMTNLYYSLLSDNAIVLISKCVSSLDSSCFDKNGELLKKFNIWDENSYSHCATIKNTAKCSQKYINYDYFKNYFESICNEKFNLTQQNNILLNKKVVN